MITTSTTSQKLEEIYLIIFGKIKIGHILCIENKIVKD
jgi:hypothetical protein